MILKGFGKVIALLILLALTIFITLAIVNAGAQSPEVGNLTSLGYNYNVIGLYGADTYGPFPFQDNYELYAGSNNSIGELTFYVPWDTQGEILYFNLVLEDGSTHKGSYENLGNDQWQIYLDGGQVTGNYSYPIDSTIEKLLGQYKYNLVCIDYAANYNNPDEAALYIYSDTNHWLAQGYQNNVIALPLNNESDGIQSFSASANVACLVQYEEASIANNTIMNLGAESGLQAENNSSTSVTNWWALVSGFGSDMVSIGSAMITLVGFVFEIAVLFLNPTNLVMELMLLEECMAIMALSGPGDMLQASQKWFTYNAKFFTFTVNFARALVQVISYVIQALAQAAQAGASLGQTALSAAQSAGTWILTLLAILPK